MKRIIDYIVSGYLWLSALTILFIFSLFVYLSKDSSENKFQLMILVFLIIPIIIQCYVGYKYLKGNTLAKIIALLLISTHIIVSYENSLKFIPISILFLAIISYFIKES